MWKLPAKQAQIDPSIEIGISRTSWLVSCFPTTVRPSGSVNHYWYMQRSDTPAITRVQQCSSPSSSWWIIWRFSNIQWMNLALNKRDWSSPEVGFATAWHERSNKVVVVPECCLNGNWRGRLINVLTIRSGFTCSSYDYLLGLRYIERLSTVKFSSTVCTVKIINHESVYLHNFNRKYTKLSLILQ